MEWEWNEVDGVTTLSAPAGAIQGPLQACLVFGVGRADETMPVAGITHVVEHLALQPLWHLPYSVNGSVDPVCTRFFVTGSPDDVVEFFTAITQHLRDLPVDALAQELQILRVEEQRRHGSQVGLDLGERFGPRGVGLMGWPEHGLRRVEADEVRAWSETWFTSGNAALWTSTPLPERLDLSALREGAAPSHTPVSQPLPRPRTFTRQRTDLVTVSAVMERQVGVGSVLNVASRRAFEQLRQHGGMSYGIAVDRVRLDADHSLVYLGADGSAGKYAQVFEGLVAVWDGLVESGPTEAEWTDYRRGYESQKDHPQALVGTLDNDAERHVLGLPFIPEEEHWAKVWALTSEQVRDDIASVAPTFFGVVPFEVEDGTCGWAEYEAWSAAPVAGDAHQPIEGREEGTVVLGPDGLSWIAEDERVRTVRWDDAVCCFTWDDGRRSVIGPAGEFVNVVPWFWRGGDHLVERIDAEIGDARRIRLGEGDTQYLRDPDDPESATDVRWLGSIVGAVYRSAGVDLVIDTDGFFLLFSRVTKASVDARLAYLSKSDRLTLLGSDPRNRWVPVRDIELVELRKSARARLRGARRVLFVKLRDGTVLDINLPLQEHVDTAARQFARMLGPIFQA
jgi:hypothetical protein